MVGWHGGRSGEAGSARGRYDGSGYDSGFVVLVVVVVVFGW